LNRVAPINIRAIFLTLKTFQRPIGWLNNDEPPNKSDMSVTPDTSHSPIGTPPFCCPQLPVGDALIQRETAARSLSDVGNRTTGSSIGDGGGDASLIQHISHIFKFSIVTESPENQYNLPSVGFMPDGPTLPQ
jgi:hypothetical protein